MAIATDVVEQREIVYPDSDGKPMADNTKQFRWIVTIEGGLDVLFRNDPNVFVAGDLLWYPVEGRTNICTAPDAMVAFGRPKGDRGSYMQWREGSVAPQVVWEVLSPGNRAMEMSRKFAFYQKYGVEEYYIYDPDEGELSGYVRSEGLLDEIPVMQGWVSPRLGVRMQLEGDGLALFYPDGRRFLSYNEVVAQAEAAQQQAEAAQQQAEAAQQQAEQERARADRLAERLRALGVDPNDV